MTFDQETRALLEQALEALTKLRVNSEDYDFGPAYEGAKQRHKTAITALRAALAQQEQPNPYADADAGVYGPEYQNQTADEPVAIAYDFDGYGYRYIDNGSGSNWKEVGMNWEDAVPLYTRPQPTAWVGLTDEERDAIWYSVRFTGPDELAKAIEAKLKEKNT